MFPGPYATIIRNEAGEPIGWDNPSYEKPYEDFEDQERRYYEEYYCDYCEQEGHTFRTCPQRDDDPE